MPRIIPFAITDRGTPTGVSGRGGSGSGVIGQGTDQNYILSEASTAGTTGTTVTSWVQNGDDVTITFEGAGSAFALPSDGDYVEWLIRDADGSVVQLELEDVFNVALRVRGYVPEGVQIMAVVTSGGLASAGGGMAWGFRYNASGNLACDSEHAGSAWSAVTVASSADGIARIAFGGFVQSNGISGARNACTPADGSGRPSVLPNSTTSPGLSNVEIGGKFTHIALVVMRYDTSGANGVSIDVGLSAYAYPQQSISSRRNLWELSNSSQSGVISKVFVFGNSQVGSGGGTDTVRGSGGSGDTSVPGSLDFVDGGSGSIVTWPSECAGRPYLSDVLVAQEGWTSGWVEWWGSNGLALNPPASYRTAMSTAMLSIADRDDGDPQLSIIVLSENDCQDASEAALFEDSLRDMFRALRYEWPNCRILCFECSDADTGGSYPFRETVRAHAATVVAEFSDAALVQADGAALADDVHYSPGPSGGHKTMMDRAGLLLTA